MNKSEQHRGGKFWSEEFLSQVMFHKDSVLEQDPPSELLTVAIARFFKENYQRGHSVQTVVESLKLSTTSAEYETSVRDILQRMNADGVLLMQNVGDGPAFRTASSWLQFATDFSSTTEQQPDKKSIWFGIDVDAWKAILTGKVEAPRADFGMYIILKILTEMNKLKGSWDIAQLMKSVRIPVVDSLKRQMVGFALENMTAENVLVNTHGRYTPWDKARWFIDNGFQEMILKGIKVVEPVEAYLEAHDLQENVNILDVHIPTIRDTSLAGDRTLFRINGDWIFTQHEIQKAYSIMNLGPLAHSNEVPLEDIHGWPRSLSKASVGALNTVIRQVWKGHDAVKIGANAEQPAERIRQVFSTHPELDELPETEMLDPRIRDLLEDAVHVGKKAERILMGR